MNQDQIPSDVPMSPTHEAAHLAPSVARPCRGSPRAARPSEVSAAIRAHEGRRRGTGMRGGARPRCDWKSGKAGRAGGALVEAQALPFRASARPISAAGMRVPAAGPPLGRGRVILPANSPAHFPMAGRHLSQNLHIKSTALPTGLLTVLSTSAL